MKCSRALLVGLLFSASAALAETPRPPVRHVEVPETPRTQGDDVSNSYTDKPYLGLRMFPVRLLSGVGQIGAEIRVLDKFSVLPQLAYGRVSVKDPSTLQSQRKSYTELELFGRYYPLGDLAGGLYVSPGFSYAAVDTDQLINGVFYNLSAGTHAAVALGGNYLFPFRITFDIQFLMSYRLSRPAPSQPSPPDSDRAAPFRVGFVVAIGYLF